MLLLVILLFEMVPNYSTEVLFSVPKLKKTVMCFMEKISVLEKLHSGMSSSAVSCEFNISESGIYIT